MNANSSRMLEIFLLAIVSGLPGIVAQLIIGIKYVNRTSPYLLGNGSFIDNNSTNPFREPNRTVYNLIPPELVPAHNGQPIPKAFWDEYFHWAHRDKEPDYQPALNFTKRGQIRYGEYCWPCPYTVQKKYCSDKCPPPFREDRRSGTEFVAYKYPVAADPERMAGAFPINQRWTVLKECNQCIREKETVIPEVTTCLKCLDYYSSSLQGIWPFNPFRDFPKLINQPVVVTNHYKTVCNGTRSVNATCLIQSLNYDGLYHLDEMNCTTALPPECVQVIAPPGKNLPNGSPTNTDVLPPDICPTIPGTPGTCDGGPDTNIPVDPGPEDPSNPTNPGHREPDPSNPGSGNPGNPSPPVIGNPSNPSAPVLGNPNNPTNPGIGNPGIPGTPSIPGSGNPRLPLGSGSALPGLPGQIGTPNGMIPDSPGSYGYNSPSSTQPSSGGAGTGVISGQGSTGPSIANPVNNRPGGPSSSTQTVPGSGDTNTSGSSTPTGDQSGPHTGKKPVGNEAVALRIGHIWLASLIAAAASHVLY
ncbi:uncharacterized protein SPPG_06448 [Spizellomyces punctatus DAOM BR117]|uniref:Uncharacterized protein n=1 Tax=Spizellomyces punctatus (strain DAOM BR117) TaxID=645134 RepID=A0A0L0HAV9_SPIPD|nr:uncharacterized protein SPPG_06448 [Spizellomyces punctatus DAOM BR117]KNC98029.1 hypothetical protein SPPG_06448 [Spizellomyces punctatus DAOM BR117]|eukprot:XP_016606069.1 hypothetical protein SPPG_06448 [Spizellomyces punctatus DAOM BR117]